MWRTIDIVPSSIRSDPQVIAACESIDLELQQIYTDFLPETADPEGAGPSILFWPFTDTMNPPLLDVIAWELHVDVWQGWDGDLTIEEKRALINDSIEWHRHLGTKWVVEDMLKKYFTEGYVQEWFDYGGNPYYFRVITNEPIVEPERLQRMLDGIYAVKNVRSWMEVMTQPASVSRAQMYVTVWVAQRYKEVRIPVSLNPDLNP